MEPHQITPRNLHPVRHPVPAPARAPQWPTRLQVDPQVPLAAIRIRQRALHPTLAPNRALHRRERLLTGTSRHELTTRCLTHLASEEDRGARRVLLGGAPGGSLGRRMWALSEPVPSADLAVALPLALAPIRVARRTTFLADGIPSIDDRMSAVRTFSPMTRSSVRHTYVCLGRKD